MFYITRRQDLETENLAAVCADILRDGSKFLLVVAYIPLNQKEGMKLLTEPQTQYKIDWVADGNTKLCSRLSFSANSKFYSL